MVAQVAVTAVPISGETRVKDRQAPELPEETDNVLAEDLYVSVSEPESDHEEEAPSCKWNLKPIDLPVDPRPEVATGQVLVAAVQAAIKIPSQVFVAITDAGTKLTTEEITYQLITNWLFLQLQRTSSEKG